MEKLRPIVIGRSSPKKILLSHTYQKMQEKTLKFRYKNSPIEIKADAAIKPEMLYGKQKKSIEIQGIPLEKVLITPWGEIFKTNDFTVDRLDEDGSLSEDPIACSPEDRTELPILPSSYKTTRLLEDAKPEDLLNLKTRSVIPIQTTLPRGLYKSQYNYRDSAITETAILTIQTDGKSFLLIGESTNPPYLKKEETYSFFNEDENENDEETSFSLF